MTWYQQTIIRCVLFVARMVAEVAGEHQAAAELRALSNHIAVYREPKEKVAA